MKRKTTITKKEITKQKTNKKNNTLKAFEKMEKRQGGHFRVSIFGSSKIEHDDEIYKKVYHLAMQLAEHDIDVITGGGAGLMRAANEGHQVGAENAGNGAHSIGIGVHLPWNQKFNGAVKYKEKFSKFSRRLDKFMHFSNAVIVTPGGLGTMLELFYTWQLVQVHHICDTPIILMGDQWGGLLKWVKESPLKNGYLEERDYRLVYHVKNEKEAMHIITEAQKHFKKGGKDFCLNYEMYRIK